jgi:tetratricopeptide (TPR) repeat protein
MVYFELMWMHLFWGNFERCVECCDAGIHLAAEMGVPPVQYPTLKALALLFLGRYAAARESLACEVADEAHRLGSAFQRFGTGTYLLELMAHQEAADTYTEVIEQASSIGRAWLSDWARAQLIRSLVRAKPIDRAKLDRVVQDLERIRPASTIRRLYGEPATVLGEVALAQGNLDGALRHAQSACAETQESGYRSGYVAALELQLRVLLRLDRPGDAIVLAETGIQMAEETGTLPMLWRIHASKAQALEMIGQAEASAQAYAAAATILLDLADAIPDASLKRNYLANPLVSAILAASTGTSQEKL